MSDWQIIGMIVGYCASCYATARLLKWNHMGQLDWTVADRVFYGAVSLGGPVSFAAAVIVCLTGRNWGGDRVLEKRRR